MMSDMNKRNTSSVESNPWPEKLPAHVASEGTLHGYDVYGDLAVNYDFGEFVVIAITGRPPSRAWGRAANIALVILAHSTIADASVHAASVARRCGADAKSTLATGLIVLTEEAAALVNDESPPEDREAVLRTLAELPEDVQTQVGQHHTSVRTLALSILTALGIEDPMQQMSAICMARLPVLAAESHAARPKDLRSYPMQLPRFEYEPPERDA